MGIRVPWYAGGNNQSRLGQFNVTHTSCLIEPSHLKFSSPFHEVDIHSAGLMKLCIILSSNSGGRHNIELSRNFDNFQDGAWEWIELAFLQQGLYLSLGIYLGSLQNQHSFNVFPPLP